MLCLLKISYKHVKVSVTFASSVTPEDGLNISKHVGWMNVMYCILWL